MQENNYYISAEALEELKKELNHRKTNVRREIAADIQTAKEQGDLSENFEYQDAKERQAANEGEIIRLDDRISKAIIVEKQSGDRVKLGGSFTAKDAAGNTHRFEIVGGSEANPMEGKISHESPLGNAFLGAKEGDDVAFEAPSGTISYKVISIE
ncbi:MAG: transcription elongation factor GreA [bacterium]|nr:transcription elongation factor GreA [bacterium]